MLNKVKIEKNFPLPEGVKLAKRPATVKKPYEGTEKLALMNLGDSFTVKGATARGVRNLIHRSRIRQNMKFVSRTQTTKSGKTFARVWRVK